MRCDQLDDERFTEEQARFGSLVKQLRGQGFRDDVEAPDFYNDGAPARFINDAGERKAIYFDRVKGTYEIT